MQKIKKTHKGIINKDIINKDIINKEITWTFLTINDFERSIITIQSISPLN